MRLTAARSMAVLLIPLLVEGQEASSAGTESPGTDVRKEMLSEYKFAPPGAKPFAPSTSLHSDSSPVLTVSGSRKDVVKMEAFEVRESGLSNSGYLALEAKAPVDRPSPVARKLGIGEHGVDVGKVHVFAVTVFYIPILVGFSW